MISSPALVRLGLSAGVLFFAIGCSNTPQEQREQMNDRMEKIEDKMDEANKADDRQEWVEDKNAVAKELRDLQADIEKKLAKTEEKLADKDLKADDKRKHEAMRAELRKEKEIVGTQVANVDGATNDTWNTVKSDARKAMDDIKIWWDKQEENVDKKTDSDNDHDGH
ncbi:MAG TPA: hypothetical protein VHL57_10955 [Flavobacteriales bacterium]|jgi:hypothetical protein|nr:hypothetical protein [Flavobacteriales bacterium]